ncbi:MAG: hypothetical protein KIT72_13345 [Polyangiaceae bacterium]|nr:hypothetical protein [Polyangiaceae bacterium]MCW5791397.1 hypothetical protein [Polyangiaceae bacterium]
MAISAGFGTLSGFLPLLGGPGYEAALVGGLVLPSFAGFIAALAGLRGQRTLPTVALFDGLWVGTLTFAAALAPLMVHGLVRGLCDVWGDLWLMLLGPGVGCLLGGAWGAVLGVLLSARAGLTGQGSARPRLLRTRVALAVVSLPLASALVSLWRFWASPMVFAYDPFVGFFSGSIYDTQVAAEGLLSYRIGSAASLIFTYVVLAHLRRRRGRERRHAQLRLRYRSAPLSMAGIASLTVSLGVTLNGPALGHYYTTADVQEELSGRVSHGRCDLVYDPTLPKLTMAALARDCDASLRQLEAYFGAPGPERVTAYLFASGAQKQRLMGALHVYIAKPWRREVYLQHAGYPHPVLVHELAHVVSGAYAKGPFKVPGALHGVLANPGLIEGVAVAAAPDEDDDLTLDQWARAMRDLELLPPLSRVLHLGFLGENSSKAYTVAGAFVDWFRAEYGAAALRAWYGGAQLHQLTGKELPELERAWLQSLDEVEVPPLAMGVARARFDRPSIFGRRCPRAVDERYLAARRVLYADPAASLRECQGALDLDPSHLGARLTWAQAAALSGDRAASSLAYAALEADERLALAQRALATEALGDLALARRELSTARGHYERASLALLGEDQLRALDLKRGADTEDALAALVALLIGAADGGPEPTLAAELLGRWSERAPEDGLPDYLLGRSHYSNGRFSLALPLLERALQKTIEAPRARAEAARVTLFTACALGEAAPAVAALKAYRETPGVPAARLQGVLRFAERCGLTP